MPRARGEGAADGTGEAPVRRSRRGDGAGASEEPGASTPSRANAAAEHRATRATRSRAGPADGSGAGRAAQPGGAEEEIDSKGGVAGHTLAARAPPTAEPALPPAPCSHAAHADSKMAGPPGGCVCAASAAAVASNAPAHVVYASQPLQTYVQVTHAPPHLTNAPVRAAPADGAPYGQPMLVAAPPQGAVPMAPEPTAWMPVYPMMCEPMVHAMPTPYAWAAPPVAGHPTMPMMAAPPHGHVIIRPSAEGAAAPPPPPPGYTGAAGGGADGAAAAADGGARGGAPGSVAYAPGPADPHAAQRASPHHKGGDPSTAAGGGGAGAGGANGAHANRTAVTFEAVMRMSHLPIEQAAKSLGVCTTVVKRICRWHGVTRWPYRKIASITKCIESLNEQVACGSATRQDQDALQRLHVRRARLARGDEDSSAHDEHDDEARAGPTHKRAPRAAAGNTSANGAAEACAAPPPHYAVQGIPTAAVHMPAMPAHVAPASLVRPAAAVDHYDYAAAGSQAQRQWTVQAGPAVAAQPVALPLQPSPVPPPSVRASGISYSEAHAAIASARAGPS